MNNHTPSEVREEITYPFPNLNDWTVVISPALYNGCNFAYPYRVGSKLIHASKRGPTKS